MLCRLLLAMLLAPSFVASVPIAEDTKEMNTFSPSTTNDVTRELSLAFPLPVTSYGVHWWLYSREQMHEYGEAFSVMSHVDDYTLPLDPKRIWPGVPLQKIATLHWDETLEKNPHYKSSVKKYLQDWYRELVHSVEANSTKVLNFYADDSNFVYIQTATDVDSIKQGRDRLSREYYATLAPSSFVDPDSDSSLTRSPSWLALATMDMTEGNHTDQPWESSTPMSEYTRESFDDPPYAFPLPVMSFGVPWWIYSPEQAQKYAGDFEVTTFVHPEALLLDPYRIWPKASLKTIGDLKWDETLRKNPYYSPEVRAYLIDWYKSLVHGVNGPDSQKILDFFANVKHFRYILSPSDVQAVMRERERLSSKHNILKFQHLINDSTSNPASHAMDSNSPPPQGDSIEMPSFNDSIAIPLEESSEDIINITYVAQETSQDDLVLTATTPVTSVKDAAEEDPAPSVLDNWITSTLEDSKQFEDRAVNFFYRMAMNSYLSNEDKAKDAIKCVLGLDCGVPSFIKEMLQTQGLPILLHGTCTPGACSKETEEIARTFRDQLSSTYPVLFNATINLIEDLGKQNATRGAAIPLGMQNATRGAAIPLGKQNATKGAAIPNPPK